MRPSSYAIKASFTREVFCHRAISVDTSDQSIAVIGLRGQTNERGEFLIATTPAIVDGSNTSGPLMFPHLVTGGGYTTEFLLLSNGFASNGTMLFHTQAGNSFEMPLSSY